MRQRILFFILGLTLLAGWWRLCLAASGYQAQNLGYVNLNISSMTAAAIAATTPTAVGNLQWCYNCGANGSGVGTLCVSTETTTAQNAFVLSTGTVCK